MLTDCGFQKLQRARVRVEFGLYADRHDGLVLDMPDHQAANHRHAERFAAHANYLFDTECDVLRPLQIGPGEILVTGVKVLALFDPGANKRGSNQGGRNRRLYGESSIHCCQSIAQPLR